MWIFVSSNSAASSWSEVGPKKKLMSLLLMVQKFGKHLLMWCKKPILYRVLLPSQRRSLGEHDKTLDYHPTYGMKSEWLQFVLEPFINSFMTCKSPLTVFFGEKTSPQLPPPTKKNAGKTRSLSEIFIPSRTAAPWNPCRSYHWVPRWLAMLTSRSDQSVTVWEWSPENFGECSVFFTICLR